MKALLDWLDPEGRAFWKLSWGPAAIAAVAVMTFAGYFFCEPLRRALWLLDGVDLVIHEAGHVIFSILGSRFLMFLGGTILQLAMPAAFFFHFLRRGQPKSADVCLCWVGQNFLHIGRYVADARAQALPLVGGGEHDWTYLLEVFGLLRLDTAVGGCVDFAGCFIMALALYSLWPHWRQGRV